MHKKHHKEEKMHPMLHGHLSHHSKMALKEHEGHEMKPKKKMKKKKKASKKMHAK